MNASFVNDAQRDKIVRMCIAQEILTQTAQDLVRGLPEGQRSDAAAFIIGGVAHLGGLLVTLIEVMSGVGPVNVDFDLNNLVFGTGGPEEPAA